MDEIYIDSLPTYAAAAWVHGKVTGAPPDERRFLDEVRAYARGEYAAALAKGDGISTEEEAAVAAQLSRMIGLPVEYLKRCHLRVEMESFRKELLRDQGLIIGRFDSRFSGPDPGIDEPLTTPDTALDLAAVMGSNPHLLVLSLNGLYDMSTPFFGTEYDLSHMLLPENLRRNITIKYYDSGHQTYADPAALKQMKIDLDQFYRAAAGRESASPTPR